MVVLLLCLISGGVALYVALRQKQAHVREAVARGEYQIPLTDEEPVITADNWQVLYPNTVPLLIGSTTVKASVADSLPERIKGLSDTPFMPADVVKLFVFGSLDTHSIWMKDMQYPLDIFWLTENGIIVHIEQNVSPDSYPQQSFASPVPAWYVIEANAGFAASNTISIGDKVVLID